MGFSEAFEEELIEEDFIEKTIPHVKWLRETFEPMVTKGEKVEYSIRQETLNDENYIFMDIIAPELTLDFQEAYEHGFHLGSCPFYISKIVCKKMIFTSLCRMAQHRDKKMIDGKPNKDFHPLALPTDFSYEGTSDFSMIKVEAEIWDLTKMSYNFKPFKPNGTLDGTILPRIVGAPPRMIRNENAFNLL